MSTPIGPVQSFDVASQQDDGRYKPQFAHLIRQFSDRTKRTSLYSGEHFKFLADYLETPTPKAIDGNPLLSIQFPPVHLLVNKPSSSSAHVGTQDASLADMHCIPVLPTDELMSVLVTHTPGPQTSLIIFLSGWQCADWLRVLGAQCGLEPELMRRHLAFLDTRKFFDQPQLPSSQLAVWRLRTVSIYVRKTALSPDAVRRRRLRDESEIRKYNYQLRHNQVMGRSILRQHALIDETTSAIMQDVSLSVCIKKTGGWFGYTNYKLIKELYGWMPDVLSHQTLHHGFQSLGRVTNLERTLTYLSCYTGLGLSSAPEQNSVASTTKVNTPLPAAVSISPPCSSFSHLPGQYGSTLDPALARADAFYAFSELISQAASAENQFLNLLQTQIDIAIAGYRGVEAYTLDNLQYLTALLKDLTERSEEIVYLLQNEAHCKWPRAAEHSSWQSRETVRRLLQDDYLWILKRGRAAKQRVQDGIAAITTDITTRDAQQSMDQAREIGRITVLAYFFLPLSFTTSIFGMNFVEFTNTNWGVCSVLGTFVVVMIPSLILCFWDKLRLLWTNEGQDKS